MAWNLVFVISNFISIGVIRIKQIYINRSLEANIDLNLPHLLCSLLYLKVILLFSHYLNQLK